MLNIRYFLERKWLVIGIWFLLLPGIAWIFFFEPNSISPAQSKLLTELRVVVNKPIKSIVIEPFDLSPNKFRTNLVKPKDISACLNFMKNADTKPSVSGHVKTLYECTLIINAEDGLNYKFIAEVFSDKPLDARLSNNFSVGKLENGTYTRFPMKHLYVGGLGKWLINREPGGRIQGD